MTQRVSDAIAELDQGKVRRARELGLDDFELFVIACAEEGKHAVQLEELEMGRGMQDLTLYNYLKRIGFDLDYGIFGSILENILKKLRGKKPKRRKRSKRTKELELGPYESLKGHFTKTELRLIEAYLANPSSSKPELVGKLGISPSYFTALKCSINKKLKTLGRDDLLLPSLRGRSRRSTKKAKPPKRKRPSKRNRPKPKRSGLRTRDSTTGLTGRQQQIYDAILSDDDLESLSRTLGITPQGIRVACSRINADITGDERFHIRAGKIVRTGTSST